MRPKHLCGFAGWHPEWLQKFANAKTFMIVYGLLGTTQGMAHLYFVVTLTTIEKRFKIPSGTSGIILTGNELSQIMLSLILSYVGGQRNRPKWIFWGMIFCSMSCFIIALPHFIYGPGDDALQLTKEYSNDSNDYYNVSSLNSSHSGSSGDRGSNKLCLGAVISESCDELFNVLPLLLLYMSQFVLGIGQTLYYSLGQSYLDDNTRRTNTPMMLAYALSLRMCGPAAGYGLGYLTLKLYIDPTKTPLIDNRDPRWLGAWWIGWIFLGLPMLLFSFLIRMFPIRIKRKHNNQLLQTDEVIEPLNGRRESGMVPGVEGLVNSDILPKLKDFPKALMVLLKNKVLIFNITSTIFYILGSTGYTMFLSKYIEVQFNKSPSDATILTGPVTIAGMATGFLLSGIVIKRYKPGPKKLFFWNVIVGACLMLGTLSYMFLSCKQSNVTNLTANLTSTCNTNCYCDDVAYSPVCSVKSGVTFFSPCHAACHRWDKEKKLYSGCGCDAEAIVGAIGNKSAVHSNGKDVISVATANVKVDTFLENIMTPGPCLAGCANTFYIFTFMMFLMNWLNSSGRIGNILLTLRAVADKDKAFSQGLALMLVSLFAFSPGPIIYGFIIDSACLVWSNKCGKQGHCQLYDREKFRFYVNGTAILLTFVGVVFDLLVWKHAKNLNLYTEPDEIDCRKPNESEIKG